MTRRTRLREDQPRPRRRAASRRRQARDRHSASAHRPARRRRARAGDELLSSRDSTTTRSSGPRSRSWRVPQASSRAGACASRSGFPSPRVSAVAAPMRRQRSRSRMRSSRHRSASRTLHRLAAGLGADVPFFLYDRPQLATGDGTALESVVLPTDYHVVLVIPRDRRKRPRDPCTRRSTSRGGAGGFEDRAASFRQAAAMIARARSSHRCRPNDLVRSPLRRPLDLDRRLPRRRLRRRPDRLRSLRARARGAVLQLRRSPTQAGRSSRDPWQDDPRSGAWPSGKATGFGPVIPGSNPGAPASVSSNGERTLGAVVMAAGLGTRMRSDVPEAPAPDPRAPDGRLGARLGARARGGAARRRRRSGDSARVRRPPGCDPGAAARHRRRGPQRATLRSTAPPTTCSFCRATRRSLRPASCASSSRRTGETAPRRPCSRSSRTTRRSTGASCATKDGGLEAIVEYRDATEAQRAVREVNSSIYVFRSDSLWPVLDRLTPHNAQGELYLTDSVALLVEDGDRVAVHKGGDPVETEGVNTRVELAAAAAVLRDRVNESHMLAGRHDRRSGEHVDRRRHGDRARRGDPSVHRHSRRDPDRRPRRDRPARRRRRLDRR